MGTVNFRKNDTYRNMYDGFLQIRGHVNAVDDLPVSGVSKGDIYTVGDSKSMYIYNESWSPMGGSDGGSVSWNDVTDKPFYTTTYPSIDLPNGIKLVIDGYVKDGAEVYDGKYDVTDTRFDITLINKADNTVLERSVGVVPVLRNQTTSRQNMEVNILFDNVHLTNGDDIEGPLALNILWSELAAFNDTIRSWIGSIIFLATDDEPMIGNVFFVPTPAKPSAVKGQDYDTVTIEDSLEGYTAYYKKADEIKKIDNKYLPDPYAALIINGNPVSESTTEQLMAMGLTKEKIDAVVNGEISYVIVQRNKQEPQLYKVIYVATDDGVYFECENTNYSENAIGYMLISFGYDMGQNDSYDLWCYIKKQYSYPVNNTPSQMVVSGGYEQNGSGTIVFVPNSGQPTFAEAVEAFESGIPVTLVRISSHSRKSSNVICYDYDGEVPYLATYNGDEYVYWNGGESPNP